MRSVRALTLALAISSITGVLATSAGAADLGREGRIASAPPVMDMPGPFSWAGFYLGGHVGYGWTDIQWEDGLVSGSHNGEGWLAGGQIGFNLQTGRLVYGLEADASSTWIDGGNDCCGHNLNWLYSVRARAGLSSDDNRWLIYATGGAAWADIDYDRAGFPGYSDTQFGWVAGGGIERALTPNLTARVEYLYYDFDKVTASAGALGGSPTSLDPSTQTVRFGLNLKF